MWADESENVGRRRYRLLVVGLMAGDFVLVMVLQLVCDGPSVLVLEFEVVDMWRSACMDSVLWWHG